ncbi:hypothetical protein HZC07_05105 [Candidatus Micrarchaeota archaeon]|nr:hypothetical protein [Candidatus Micrarchaeota archaeon]
MYLWEENYLSVMFVMRKLSVQDCMLIRFSKNFTALSDSVVQDCLIQSAHCSLQIVPLYNFAIPLLLEQSSKSFLRKFVRDEIPSNQATHHEDLCADLEKIGIGLDTSTARRPTSETLRYMDRLFKLLAPPSTKSFLFDIEIIVRLRMALETLVADEYRAYTVTALETRFGLKKEDQIFYHPSVVLFQGPHSLAFARLMKRLLENESDLQSACYAATFATETRLRFFDQFVRS